MSYLLHEILKWFAVQNSEDHSKRVLNLSFLIEVKAVLFASEMLLVQTLQEADTAKVFNLLKKNNRFI